MYDRNYWQDHVTDQNGVVVQQGTLLDQAHFNRMEKGISDQSLAAAISLFKQNQDSYNLEDELQIVKLNMADLKWPFNNVETTVALKQMRESINYDVEINVLSYSDGFLGNIRVKDRARNGFKLVHDGSAKKVQVSVRISGGMTDPILDESDIENN
jgi:hypothetical protein